ncbi:MAG: hypothetical protein AAFN10_06375 [Bacteroidota bacterium]
MSITRLTLDLRTWRRMLYVSELTGRLDPYPGIEQISWMLKDQNDRDIMRRHYLIQPGKQLFPEREVGRHAVDLAQARREGFHLEYVLQELRQILTVFQPTLIVFEWELTQHLLSEAPIAENQWDAEEVPSVFCVRANADKLPSFPPYRGTLEGMSRRLFDRELLGFDGTYYLEALWDCYRTVYEKTKWIKSPLNQTQS